MADEANQRNYNIDILRCTAIFFVISLHFLYFTGLYKYQTNAENVFYSYFINCARVIFDSGVPIFITISGFLLLNKKWDKHFYLKLINMLLIYFVICLITVFGNVFIMSEPFSAIEILKEIFHFTYIHYAWFLEMYVGLYLVSPFLNLIFKNLNSKPKRIYYIATLIFLTLIFAFAGKNYYWTALMPLVYYAIGNFFFEYKKGLNSEINIILLCLSVLIFGGLNFISGCSGMIFGQNKINAFENIIILCLIFNLILNKKFILNEKVKKILAFLSKHIYGVFLSSFIVDKIIYHILNNFISAFGAVNVIIKTLCYFMIVPSVFCISLLISFFVNYLFKITNGLKS